MRRIPLLILILCAAYTTAFAQGEIPVDLYTGTPSISIPLGTVSAIDVSQPVVLSYNANSAGLNSVVGSGWSLQAGGKITREVRGLPDDVLIDDTDNTLDRIGWLYHYSAGRLVAKEVGSFVPQSDTISVTYGNRNPNTGEIYDFEKLESYNNKYDTEPDVFSFSFNGRSGKFVFDNDGVIRTIPYMDLKIEPIYTNGKLNTFSITTNDGYKYTFTATTGGTKQITKDSDWTSVHIMATQYHLYRVPIPHITAWILTEMRSPAGNTITYVIPGGSPELSSYWTEDVRVAMYYRNTLDQKVGPYEYMSKEIYNLKRPPTLPDTFLPTRIESSTGEKVEFVYDSEMIQKITFRDSRKGTYPNDFVRSVEFTYVDVAFQYYTNTGPAFYTIKYLNKVRQIAGDCERTRPYTFGYNYHERQEGEGGPPLLVTLNYIRPEVIYHALVNHDDSEDVQYPEMYVYPNEPMKERYRLDPIPGYSGTSYFYDGTFKGTGYVHGTLTSLEYPEGGRTTFTFEQHAYHDTKDNCTRYAPGMRIGSIMYHDGAGKAVEKTFSYYDENLKSTGRIFRKPIYNIPAYRWQNFEFPNSFNTTHSKSYGAFSTTEERYKYLTIRTESDIAPHDSDNTVGYTRVTVRRSGSGWAVHEFEVPGVYGEISNGEWQTPETVFAREPQTAFTATPSVNMASTIFPTGGRFRYPNAPNPFYDYARGLPHKVSSYSQTGKLVKKIVTTYQDLYRSGNISATKVYGLAYDRMALSDHNILGVNRIYLLSRYFLLTDSDKVPQTETVTLYNAIDTTKRVTETTEYIYNGASHKFVTEVKRTATDGTIYRTKLKYPLDYTNQSSGEAAVTSLKALVDNFRHGSPVETVSTMKKGSDPEVVLGASVVKYNSFNGIIGLASAWTLELGAPLAVSSFTNSSIANVSGYKFIIDGLYKQQSEIQAYLSNGIPTQVMSPVTRDTTETAFGFGAVLPVAKSVNAASNQVVISDFDNTTDFSLTASTSYLSQGRSGNYAFYPCVPLTKNNMKRVAANKYIVGFWLKSNTTTNFTVNITNTSSPYSTTYATLAFSELTTDSEFKYIQKIIDVGTITAAVKTFRVELKTTGLSIPGTAGYTANLLPVIDDVFFFPEGVQVESYDYTIPFGVSMITSGTGGASHITYDGLGREKYIQDRNLNIVKHTTYQRISETPLFAEFTIPSGVYLNWAASFEATVPGCITPVTYEWDWDDGAGFVTGTASTVHTFTTLGERIVKLRVSAPDYPSQTTSMWLQVEREPITGELCARGLSDLTGSNYSNGYSCSEISVQPTQGHTTFKVINLSGCDDGCPYTYTWYWRLMGTQMYMPVQTGGNEYTSAKAVPGDGSYEVICKVTRYVDGREAWIGPLSVFISQPEN